MQDVRFLYIRDPRTEHRVLTLARQDVDGQVHITWCMNRVAVDVDSRRLSNGTMRYMRCEDVWDAFSKKKAQEICRGRLKVGRAIMAPIFEGAKTHDYIDLILREACRPAREWDWVNEKFKTFSGEAPALPRVNAIISAYIRAYTEEEEQNERDACTEEGTQA